MSDRPTPETDALDCELHTPRVLQDRYSEMRDHAQKLERERDEALMDRARGETATMTINHYERNLRERNKLRQWKKEMLLIESQWDEQIVGRLLGLQLGDYIKPNIEPKLRQLIRERDEARDKYDTLATEHMLVVNKLCKERDDALKGNQ